MAKKGALTTDLTTIVEYWACRIDEADLNIFWSEAHERCWRCNSKKLLHRCHIVARGLGGSDEPSNLVLLCSECHADSPDVDDPEIMWDWLRAYKVSYPPCFWIEQGFREYEFMYKRSVLDEFAFLEEHGVHFNFGNMAQDIRENAAEMIRHFGLSHSNPSTLAGSLRHFLKKKAAAAGVELPAERRSSIYGASDHLYEHGAAS